LARDRKRRLNPEAKRQRRIAAATRGFKRLLSQPRPTIASQASQPNRFAIEVRANHQLAERVGGKHFNPVHLGYWRSVRWAFSGSHDSTAEFLEEFVAASRRRRPQQHHAHKQHRSVEMLLHEALLRQHDRGFNRLASYLDWLCKELLPRVLHHPERAFLRKRGSVCWRVQILHEVVRFPAPDPPSLTRQRVKEDRRDFVRITRAILKNPMLRAALLSLYFLYPKAVRAQRGDRAKRRPLFHALNDLCLHWDQRREDGFNRVLDLLAWNPEQFEQLHGEKLARALFKSATGLELDNWCEQQGIDPSSFTRRLNRAMVDLRLHEKRTRSDKPSRN